MDRATFERKVECICVVCGTTTLRRRCEVSRFCSHACYTKSRIGVRPKEVTKPCARCGTVMKDSVTQIGKYCSKRCCDLDKITDPVERFWSYVKKGDGCWAWRGGRNRQNYGKFWVNGRTTPAPRYAYEITYGPVGSLYVCHHCDNPSCVRPDHLFAGTPADNMRDKIAKDRAPVGDKHPSRLHPERLKRGRDHWRAKLTETDIQIIRAASAAGVARLDLAQRFNISSTNISAIVKRKIWQHVK